MEVIIRTASELVNIRYRDPEFRSKTIEQSPAEKDPTKPNEMVAQEDVESSPNSRMGEADKNKQRRLKNYFVQNS